jgi:hypothetical protein
MGEFSEACLVTSDLFTNHHIKGTGDKVPHVLTFTLDGGGWAVFKFHPVYSGVWAIQNVVINKGESYISLTGINVDHLAHTPCVPNQNY